MATGAMPRERAIMEMVAGPSGPRRPCVRGALPGPRSAAALAAQERWESGARTYPRRLPVAVARGRGSYVEDLDGNVFIDFLTGAGALPLGHSHPELLAAVADQLPTLQHGLDFPTPVREAFAEAQLARLPAALRDRARIAFCGPTGANAVEAALKLCKTATGRSEVIAFQGGYHGGSHGAMAVSGLVAQKASVGGQMPGVHFFPYPRGRGGALPDDASGLRCAEYLERSLRDPLGGIPRPAAVLLEVVQGEGGVNPAPGPFVREVRRITAQLGIPLIVDEVQTGCGRTGTWYAFERHGIVPDVIVASKALGGLGLPVAIVLYDERLDVWAPGAHTGTFRGNQLAFAAGLAYERIVARDGLLEHVRSLGEIALARLRALAERHAWAVEARGVGLMLGLEVVDPGGGEPAGALAGALQRACLQRGLIVEVGGRDDRVVRLLPALNVSAATLEQGLAVLEQALAEVSSARPVVAG